MTTNQKFIISNEKKASALLTKLREADVIGFDTESEGPKLPGKKMLNVYRSFMVGYSIAFEDGEAYYIPLQHPSGNLKAESSYEILCAVRDTPVVWAHNWAYDVKVLRMESIDMGDNMRCSKIAAWLANMHLETGNKLGLKPLAKHYCDAKMDNFAEVAANGKFSTVPTREAYEYAAADALYALRLGQIAEELLRGQDLLTVFAEVQMPMMRCLDHIEWSGMKLNPTVVLSLRGKLSKKLSDLEEEWQQLLPGVSITSVKQVASATYPTRLWSAKGVGKTRTGELQVNTEALKLHASRGPAKSRRLAEIKLEYQAMNKLYGSYTTSLIVQGTSSPDRRIHPNYNQTGTATGRLSCSNPNLQQIPNKSEIGQAIKACFIPEEGRVFVTADFSQLELRILAHYAGEGVLVDSYVEGKDVHQGTADKVGVERHQGKTLNFATVYGAAGPKLAKMLGVSVTEAERFIALYKKELPEVERTKALAVAALTSKGYVRTLLGRRRYIDGCFSQNKYDRFRAERLALNTPIQGGAADIVTKAMVALFRKLESNGWLGKKVWIVSQIHDEITLECNEELVEDVKVMLKDCMENTTKLKVPLVADPGVGKNWMEAK